MLKRTNFLNAALEELQQGTDVSSVATAGEGGQSGLTETHVDSSVDAVAELMEKNNELSESKATLEGETFDNDVDVINSTTDSVHSDLDEAVQAGAALEELSYIATFAARNGQANKAAVAGYALALGSICRHAQLKNPLPALEDALVNTDPQEQAKTIGETAGNKAKEIVKKLLEGIKRLAGWAMSVVRALFARISNLSARAKKLGGQLNEIDKSKTIDAEVFIRSLRLVKGGGDPNKQFSDYGRLATKTLFSFFGNSFGTSFMNSYKELTKGNEEDDTHSRVVAKVQEIVKVLMHVAYPENGTPADMGGSLPEGVSTDSLTVAKTAPCIGGLQLAIAATLHTENPDEWFCKSGPVKQQPEIDAPTSIPVVDPHMAQDFFSLIQTWERSHHVLESNFKVFQTMNFGTKFNPGSAKSLKVFISAMTAMASGCMPYMLRLNIQNSANFLAYVEKSIAVSKGEAAPEKK